MKPSSVRVEELVNAVTHGIGLTLSIIGAVLLIVAAAWTRDAWVIVSCCVYAATLVSLYAASTMLHSVTSPRWARPLEIIDHSCIYFLIAGTYTPVTLVSLRGGSGWTLFGFVWGLSFLGVLAKVLWFEHVQKLSTPLYVALGLLAVIGFKPLLSAVGTPGLLWLAAGGVAYISGIAFYAWRRLPFNHGIWHLFVMAGSLCHYVAIYYYVVPRQG
ncbi:MAG TPA: hemolysin III family protein [Candidatus Sulfotelmatobacter sp.]|nr:hemolysin III family protein [Candidatus Sulfotelmatobacter sp.]